MKKTIYKITNLINNKAYIGQTKNIKRRFAEHRAKGYSSAHNYEGNKILYLAFDKYGIENFKFEIIEEDVENYNEREIYWIKYYNTYENGYNMSEGGEKPPVKRGEENSACTHSKEEVKYIKKLLKETSISPKDIAKLTTYNTSSINRINVGELWFDENEDYPIRKNITRSFKIERAENIKYDLLNTDLSQTEIAKKYGVGRTTVTAINQGQNFRDNNLKYPLRR